MFVPYEDPTSDATHYHIPPSAYAPSAAPVPGATAYALVHDHPTREGRPAYSFHGTTTLPDGTAAECAVHPGDTMPSGDPAPLCPKAPEDTTSFTGDSGDRNFVAYTMLPTFQVTNGGFVWRLNYPQTIPPTATRFRPAGGSAAQAKCSWPKKYNG